MTVGISRVRPIRAITIVGLIASGLVAGPLAGVAHAAPVTFVVNTAGNAADTFIDGNCDTDGGTSGSQCTLRGAIQEANANVGPDTITFGLPSPYSVTLTSAGLPAITSPVLIDGTSLSGYNPTTGVIVRVDAAAQPYAFNVQSTASGTTITGLEIDRASAAGIRLAADANVVSGNYIGTTAGSLVKCVGTNSCSDSTGVLIAGGSNNMVGGTTPTARNVISNNSNYGIEISGASSGNTIAGNFIGTNVAGTAKLANGTGVEVDGSASTNTSVGGAGSGAGNVISGNSNYGVELGGGSATIAGNIIGLKATGTGALANSDGIYVNGNNTVAQIGGTASGAGNVISGNSSEGVQVSDGTATITGNLIGLDSTGTTAMPNSDSGVYAYGAASIQVGGTLAGSRNVISGSNNNYGVYLAGSTGTATVQGNYIGTDITGSTKLGSLYADVEVDNQSNALVDGNVMVGASYGLYSSSTDGLVVTNNKIGTDAGGTLDRGNSYGIYLYSDPDATIGGPGAGNLISANDQYGIYAVYSDDGTIQGNLIGTDASGTNALGNTDGGVVLDSSTNVAIGGTATGAGNVVAATGTNNTTPGISLTNSDDNVLFGNNIGVGSTGGPLPNGIGVLADSGSDRNQIGDTGTGAANVIASNNGVGVAINGKDNRIRGNSIHDNGNRGIDLGQDGVTPNDVGDADTGANRLQNFPVLSTSASNASGTQVSGSLNSRPSKQYVLDFYANSVCDSSGNGEGATYLGSTTVTTDGSGNASFQATVSGSAPAASQVTATATDVVLGDTSEFSACLANQGGLPAASIANASASEAAGVVTFTVSLSSAPVFTPVTVDYSTADGTAVSPTDYTATSGTVTFNAGETSKQITVPIVNDALDENDETFTVTLANATNAVIAAGQGTATGTINDDDAAPTVSIAHPPNVTEPDTGSVNQTFTVSLSAPSALPVTVIADTVPGGAQEEVDYAATAAQLTFAPGQTTQTFAVPVLGDTLDENTENYFVHLQSPTNATLGTASTNGTILDNDPPPTLSISDVSQVEGNGGTTSFGFTLSLSAASGKVVKVYLSTADGSAVAPSDYVARINATQSIQPGDTSATFKVKVKGNTQVEPDETFFVNIDTGQTTNATVVDSQGIGTILNDD